MAFKGSCECCSPVLLPRLARRKSPEEATARLPEPPDLGLVREHLLQVADALYEKGEAPKCLVSLSARGDAVSNSRIDNVTYTPSIVYDGLGDVLFGQRRSFSANELRQYPDGMM